MSAELLLALVTAVLAVLSAGVLALVNSSVTARAGIDENLRAQRLKAYPALWKATAAVSRWPRMRPTRAGLDELHKSYRSWYYEDGGLYLSESARARYGDVQELLAALLELSDAPTDRLVGNAYVDLMKTTSSLRTALTEDLDTRRRRSILEKRRRSRWHEKAAADARERIERAARTESAFVPSEPGNDEPADGM